MGALVLACPAQAQTITLTSAHATVRVGNAVEVQEVTLPYVWDRAHPGMSGDAVFVLTWQNSSWSTSSQPLFPWGIYLPYVGNTFEVWVNGQLLQQQGDIELVNGASYSRRPQWVALPPSVMTNGHNLLEIRFHADAMRRAGLGPVQIGPQHVLLPVYEKAYAIQLGWPLVVLAFSLTVSVWALMLWRSRRAWGKTPSREDDVYLIAALTELFWSVRMLDNVLITPPLPWPWWGMVVNTVYVLWIYCAFEFVHRVTDYELGKFRPVVQGIAGVGVLCGVLAVVWHKPVLWTYTMGFLAFVLLLYGFWFCVFTIRHANTGRMFIAGSVLVNVMAGALEWLARASGSLYGTSPYLRYTSVLFGWALVIVVMRRFNEASEEAHHLVHTLSERVKEKETEIATVYAQREQIQHEHVRHTERNRILRNMHDGVGTHVSSAIRQLESGKTEVTEVVQTLRDSLDQLKLSVDMMSFELGDVTSLLASLRYRLTPRFESSGIHLIWNLRADLPLVRGLDWDGMAHVRFMLFEIFSNALQHSKASILSVSTTLEDGRWTLRVKDNGVGFDVKAKGHKGLRFLHERAYAIGALLRIRSDTGWTCIEISFRDVLEG